MKTEDVLFKVIKKIYYSKRVRKFLKWCIILFIIYLIYSVGRMRGFMEGIAGATQIYNGSICDILDRERDTDGFCLLTKEEHKYRYYVDCGWEKFKINGERKPPFLFTVAENIRRIIYYPATGC